MDNLKQNLFGNEFEFVLFEKDGMNFLGLPEKKMEMVLQEINERYGDIPEIQTVIDDMYAMHKARNELYQKNDIYFTRMHEVLGRVSNQEFASRYTPEWERRHSLILSELGIILGEISKARSRIVELLHESNRGMNYIDSILARHFNLSERSVTSLSFRLINDTPLIVKITAESIKKEQEQKVFYDIARKIYNGIGKGLEDINVEKAGNNEKTEDIHNALFETSQETNEIRKEILNLAMQSKVFGDNSKEKIRQLEWTLMEKESEIKRLNYDLDRQKKDSLSKLDDITRNHDREIRAIKHEYDMEKDRMKSDNEKLREKIMDLKDDHSKEVLRLKEDHSKEVLRLKEEYVERTSKLRHVNGLLIGALVAVSITTGTLVVDRIISTNSLNPNPQINDQQGGYPSEEIDIEYVDGVGSVGYTDGTEMIK